jgi:hypothetical protein
MGWCYEIRGAENRLVEIRSGFANREQARYAGNRAKRMIDCLFYANFEKLTLVIREDDTALSQLAEMPSAAGGWFRPANNELGFELKYSWQELVVQAFLEPHAENVPQKIAVAEHAISRRLLDPAPFEAEERLALGEALLALRKLLRDLADPESSEKDEEDIT